MLRFIVRVVVEPRRGRAAGRCAAGTSYPPLPQGARWTWRRRGGARHARHIGILGRHGSSVSFIT